MCISVTLRDRKLQGKRGRSEWGVTYSGLVPFSYVTELYAVYAKYTITRLADEIRVAPRVSRAEPSH